MVSDAGLAREKNRCQDWMQRYPIAWFVHSNAGCDEALVGLAASRAAAVVVITTLRDQKPGLAAGEKKEVALEARFSRTVMRAHL